MIQFIVDSTAAVPKEYLESHSNVHVIPLSISVKGEYVPEYETTIEEVIDYSERTKQAIPTSQPSTGDFLTEFKKYPDSDALIVICLTSGVSGTYNGAVLAARQSGRKDIAVINSRTTAIGMMQILEDGVEMAEKGASFEDISKSLHQSALNMRTTFTVSTLDYLRRGGRIGRAAGLIGSILKIKPVIFLNDNNEVDVLAKVRTSKKATAAMLQYLHDNSPCRRIGIVHVENEEGGRELQEIVQKEYPDIHVTLSTGTPVLASYLGPGLTGIIFESVK